MLAGNCSVALQPQAYLQIGYGKATRLGTERKPWNAHEGFLASFARNQRKTQLGPIDKRDVQDVKDTKKCKSVAQIALCTSDYNVFSSAVRSY